jgi:hypothetical protein
MVQLQEEENNKYSSKHYLIMSLINFILSKMIIAAITIAVIVSQIGATIACIFFLDDVNIISGTIAKGN